MASDHPYDDEQSLLQSAPGSARFSSASTTVASPIFPVPARHRPGYARLASVNGTDDEYRNFADGQDLTETTNDAAARSGLGIIRSAHQRSARRISGQHFARAGDDEQAKPYTQLAGSADTSFSTKVGSPGVSFGDDFTNDVADSPNNVGMYSNQSMGSVRSGTYVGSRDTENLLRKSVTSTRSYADFSPGVTCPSHKPIAIPRTSWLWLILLTLSIFSTVFSGIYLAIAIRGPRYGRLIHQDRAFSISTASVLFTVFAKLIELSFVTVFVAFLGQVISRRAFMRKHGKGITLAEMSMRNWIMQPGSMITHVESVRFGIFSALGVLSLTATLIAILYTSASAALVSPQLSFGKYEPKTMQGLVKTSYANSNYGEKICYSPISDTADPDYKGSTCLAIEHAAQSYFNHYETFLKKWTEIANNGNGTTALSSRPSGSGLLNANISVTGSWIEVHNSAASVGDRIINNVSLAMPHPGVYQASIDPINRVITPEGSQGLGAFSLRASVPSPVIHVLCVNTDEAELEPIVYAAWDTAPPLDELTWPAQAPHRTNSTVFDDIFGWGLSSFRKPPLRAPIFARYPPDYETILNHTVDPIVGYGTHDGIYLLGKAGPEIGADIYTLCSIRSSITPFCSTNYNATSSGGMMASTCEDPNDTMQYIRSLPDAYSGNGYVSLDWPYIGQTWGNAINLNSGINDGKASNARLLMQLALTEPELNPALPSIAESLAVMAGCTLLMGATDSPFVTFFNYTSAENGMLNPGQYQYFNASIKSQQYASGAEFTYQKGFYVVLAAVFVGNLLVLAYFLYHDGLVTDFAEPPNLFSLSINSPPSQHFAGSCGGGPDGKHYKVNWFVNVEGDHVFLESEDRSSGERGTSQTEQSHQMEQSPILRMYSTLSKRKSYL